MKKLLLAAVTLAGLASCNPDAKLTKAVVLDTNDITGTGCGYLLVLEDSALLKPYQLDAAYQHDGMPVLIDYVFSGVSDTCNYGPKVFEMVTINKIKFDN